jgi:AraC-like DNA-binding protein
MSRDLLPDGSEPVACVCARHGHRCLERAATLFLFDERTADSPFVQKIWRTRSEPVASFISVAVPNWEIVVTRERGKISLTLRGPETTASVAPIPEDAEFFGVQFPLGTFMPSLPAGRLVNGEVTLPDVTGRSFWLNGSAWDFPTFDNADLFVNRLVGEGLLVRDPIVEAVLQGQVVDLSPRSVQRRFLRATGLTHGAIRQMARAEGAAALLEQGVPVLETVARAGYADQAHLTRSLRRFIGQTPSEIAPATNSDSCRFCSRQHPSAGVG